MVLNTGVASTDLLFKIGHSSFCVNYSGARVEAGRIRLNMAV